MLRRLYQKSRIFIGQEHMFNFDITSSLFFMRRFGHLSHVCIKISDNSIHEFIFADVMTKLT